jgi:hypothetical protein
VRKSVCVSVCASVRVWARGDQGDALHDE